MQENEKLGFKLSGWVIDIILPTRSSPSLLGNFTRLAFNHHSQVLDEIRRIPGVRSLKSDVYGTHREVQIICDSDEEPYVYMREVQKISRKYGFYAEHNKEKKHA